MARKKPKIVLWYYSEANDLANLVDEAIKYEFINYLKDDYIQNLKENQKKIDNQLNELWKKINRDYIEIKK